MAKFYVGELSPFTYPQPFSWQSFGLFAEKASDRGYTESIIYKGAHGK
jgi:hypothetical protein